MISSSSETKSRDVDVRSEVCKLVFLVSDNIPSLDMLSSGDFVSEPKKSTGSHDESKG